MPRDKKDGRFFNCFLERRIYERLKQYATDKGQPMTTAVERIIDEYLDEHDDGHSESVDRRDTIDEDLL